MSAFDPNIEPETEEQADQYVNWCAENFMLASQGAIRTYRVALRCSAWLFVVAVAPLQLDEEVEDNREALLEQLALYQALGREVERQRRQLTVERLVLLRGALDCWEPAGIWAENLLAAAKCAIGARTLIETYPLVELWDLRGEDVWGVLDAGREHLGAIVADGITSRDDYAVRPHEMVTAKYTWQRAHNVVRGAGLRIDLDPN